jgi:serine/threonine protein kinase
VVSGAPERIGPYRIMGELGRGGMGVVFKAQHTQNNALVALKVIASGDQASPEQLKRFQREVNIARELDHPGIVRVLDAGENEGFHWFAMELVEGRSLADVIREEEIDWRRAVEIVRDVADALAQAHDKGILHRDIKPSNILVGQKVTDVTVFGLEPSVEVAPATQAEPPATQAEPPATQAD